MPRRFRSVSDYLSLGAGPPRTARDKLFGPYLSAEVRQGPRPFEQRDLVVAERITVKLIRDAVAQLAEGRVPPIRSDRYITGYIDPEDGGLVFIKQGGSIPKGAKAVWHEPLPGAAEFGPHYQVNLAPQDMTALLADPEFQAGERDGEFRVAGKGVVMVRPPMVAVDDIIDPGTGKVLRREVNASRLDKET